MPSSFRDLKTLADWIQLDYFRRPRRLSRARTLLTWLVLITCLALLAFTWLPAIRFIYESHPVSSAHAMFNDKCFFCHVESFQPATRLLRGDSRVRSVLDDTCRTCHDGGPHHGNEPNCSTCHQEHRGRPILARVADTHCTVCHADLNANGGSKTGFAANITGFATDHPRFGAWQGKDLADPGTIRFNHKVHLNLQAEGLRGIEEPLAALQAQQCNYCHKPDPAGRYMKPINYGQHCRQCHALSVQIAGNWEGTPVQGPAERFANEPAPHKDPATVRAVLRERYTRFVQENPAVLASPEPAEPPRWVHGDPCGQPLVDDELAWLNHQLQTAARMVFDGANGCGYCHQRDVALGPDNLPQYAPATMTPVWFRYSIFSHERHRMLLCTACHGATESTRTSDVLIPTIDSCRHCHNPQVRTRTDCAECHRYHDRSKETFRGKLSIPDCIRTQ